MSNKTPSNTNTPATPENRTSLVQVFELCRPFRLKNVIAETHGKLHMLKNQHGNGGVTFTEAKKINAALMNFKSIDGKILKNRLKTEHVEQLYNALVPIRRMIEDRGIVTLIPSPMFGFLSDDNNIIKAHKKANPEAEPLDGMTAWDISIESKKHRTLSWEHVQHLDTLSSTLMKTFSLESRKKLESERLENKTQNLPQSRFGVDKEDDNTLNLAQ